MLEWYLFLSKLNIALTEPIKLLSEQFNIPLLTALLLGLLGSTSPCQLTTNSSAMALVSQKLSDTRGAWKTALAYTLGKITVYTGAGWIILFLGLQVDAVSIPVIVWARKAFGPLLFLVGLYLLGIVTPNISVGGRVSLWLQEKIPQEGAKGAFLMGVAFSFAFCPTLFWLFFGLLTPLALTSHGGWSFPGIFALGTALPLLAFALVLTVGTGLAASYIKRIEGIDQYMRRVAGIVFLLAGINDTLTYWAF